MIPYSRCIFAVSSTSLEDVPGEVEHALAQDYLNGWTSVWDPRVLTAFQSVPEWRRGDTSGLDLEDAVIVLPEVTSNKIDSPLRERLSYARNGIIQTSRRPRKQIVHEILNATRERLSVSESITPKSQEFAVRLAGLGDMECPSLGDFYAFGYLVMQVQCMARTLRYSFNLDWMKVGEQILSAAQASVAGDVDATERWIAAAFDSLSQERDRYCSQQGNLLELILTAPTTLGPSLASQLQVDRPQTLYATTETLRKLQSCNSDAWGHLTRRMDEKSIAIAGGLRDEQLHGYLTEMTLVRDLRVANEDYRDLELEPPTTWMRFQPSITATLPSIARKFGFQGGIIAALGGGVVPKKDHAKIRWQSQGDSLGIDCILGHILDGSDCTSLLRLGSEMAKQLDYHQVPSLILAHWPGRTCESFDDLVTAMRRSPALGKWIDAAQYFATTAQPYWTDHFGAHEFLVPLPSTAVELHQLHARLIEYVARAYRLEQLDSLQRLWQWVPRSSRAQGKPIDIEQWQARMRMAECAVTKSIVTVENGMDDGTPDNWERSIDSTIDALSQELVADLRGRVQHDHESFLFNPCSHPQRLFLSDIPGRVDARSSTRIVAQEVIGSCSEAVIDVPPFGFAKFRTSTPTHSVPDLSARNQPAARETPRNSKWIGRVFGGRSAIAQSDGSLANEFMELQIDPSKGHLRSMYVANKRGNRLSGQLQLVPKPLRLNEQLTDASFVSLQEVQLRVIHESKIRGTIEVVGEGQGNARWTIRYTLWHGARWLDVEILGEGIDWHQSYPVWRMVWPSEAATIAAWQNGARGKLPSPLQGTVELIEIDDVEHRIHFATRGLSMHRRFGPNGLVSVLPVQATGNVLARFSLGMDWPRPWEMAIDRMQLPLVSFGGGENGSSTNLPQDSGAWLAQCNLSNLRFSWIDPTPPLQVAENPETISADACLWMVETAGKAGVARLGCVRQIDRAWRVDFRGFEYDRLKVEDGELVFPFQAWERSRIAICFKD